MGDELNDTNNYDEIRPPDKVITERLVEDARCEFQKQMDEAFYLSMQELDNYQRKQQEYEEEIIKTHLNETNNRREKFSKLLTDIKKLIKFDTNVKEVYEITEPILDAYCEQHIEMWETDEETHDKIFKTLTAIRTDKIAIELLKKIIIKN